MCVRSCVIELVDRRDLYKLTFQVSFFYVPPVKQLDDATWENYNQGTKKIVLQTRCVYT
jgi:hypothetical protein